MRLCRRNALLSLLLYVIISVIIYFSFQRQGNNANDQDIQQLKDSGGCVHMPMPDSSSLRQKITPIPPDLCLKYPKSWLYVSQGRIFLEPEHNKSVCKMAQLQREDDFKFHFTSWTPLKSGVVIPSLGFKVKCKEGSAQFRHFYHPIPHQTDLDIEAGADRDNIIIIGLDSVSRLEALRSLTKSFSFMKEELEGQPLHKYNIIGDGTPAALQPILTGRMEEDWPESRRGYTGATTVDGQDWIFKELHKLGYLTLWGEEQPHVGTFHYRMLGFKDPPVHFHLRIPLLVQKEKLKEIVCIGQESQSQRLLNNVKEQFSLYTKRPKFAFIFLSLLSHENLDASFNDREVHEFMRWFKTSGLRQNTTLIFMSDHGQRYGPNRNSVPAKLEERLPLMMLSLSERLTRNHPKIQENLKHNAVSLTTPYDIHKTLHHLAAPEGIDKDLEKFHWPYSYSLLMNKVPENRSCKDAGIAPHWCSCLTDAELRQPETVPRIKAMAEFALKSINSLIKPHSNCIELRLSHIQRASKLMRPQEFLKVSRDENGAFIPPENSKNRVTESSDTPYTITFDTEPNKGVYEVTLTAKIVRDGKLLQAQEISRTNVYGKQSVCIADSYPYLRAFCYCKSSR